jgi:hypothetical protein
VLDAGAKAIYKFNSAGEPQEFTALKTDEIEGVAGAGEGENEIAVDSSSDPAKGDIYVANGSNVAIYSSSGSPLGELNGEVAGPWGEPCGVAVDPAGNVYVGLYSSNVDEYTPTANPVTNADYKSSLSGLNDVCNIAADDEGNVYVDTWSTGPVTKYPASQFGQPSASGTEIPGDGSTLAVDPLTNEVYIDNREGVSQYDSSGTFVLRFASSSEPGALDDSLGVAVYAPTISSSNVYVSNGANGQVEIYGPAVVVPDTTTGVVSNNQSGSATLEGAVNTHNTTLTSCQFEYGPTTSYGSVAPCSSTPPPGETPVTVTANLTGLQPGVLYHYRLLASNGNGGTQGTDTTFRSTPIVTDLPASDISQFAATFNAMIDPGLVPASYHFEYGTSSAYGSVIPRPDLYAPLGYTEEDIAQPVGGLEPGTTYHYALVITSVAGTTTGPEETFTTPPVPPPVASTGTATEISRSSAVLSGTIDPMGWETTYRFEYGTSIAYGSSWPTVSIDIGASTGPQPVLITLQNLQPATTYHYRLVATNPGGTSYGPDQALTTSEYPTSIIQQAPLGSLLGTPPPKTSKPKTKKPKTKSKKPKTKTKQKKPKHKKKK